MKRKMWVKDVWMALGLCYSKCYIQVWNKPIKTIHHIIFFVATLKRIITAKVIITDVITVFVIIENDDFINFSFLIWSNLKINVALAVKKKRNPAHADKNCGEKQPRIYWPVHMSLTNRKIQPNEICTAVKLNSICFHMINEPARLGYVPCFTRFSRILPTFPHALSHHKGTRLVFYFLITCTICAL